MNDILAPQTRHWSRIESQVADVLADYGFDEIRLPLLERTELFARTIGEVTDIVEKEMYTFTDRSGDSLSLRPEGTASVVRAGLQHGLLHNRVARLWYQGPMFRHERPQKGRYRQFHQIGAEVFGLSAPQADAELIALSARLWRVLGVQGLELELNTLGDADDRARYRHALVAFLERHIEALDDDSRRRLQSNPLRVLDSKVPGTRELLAGAPRLADYLSDDAGEHFAQLCAQLDRLGVAYRLNPNLVRGLDYYNRTVFEWVTDRLGAQGTVCAGGRYDGLVEQLGGRPAPALGFALGLERLVELVDPGVGDDVLSCRFICADRDALPLALELAERCRDTRAALRFSVEIGGGNLGKQLRRADQGEVDVAIIVGADELAAGTVTLKPLREPGAAQQQVAQADLLATLERQAAANGD